MRDEHDNDTQPHIDAREIALELAGVRFTSQAARELYRRQLREATDQGHTSWSILVEQLRAEMAAQRAEMARQHAEMQSLRADVQAGREEIAALREYIDRLERARSDRALEVG